MFQLTMPTRTPNGLTTAPTASVTHCSRGAGGNGARGNRLLMVRRRRSLGCGKALRSMRNLAL